MKRKVTLQGIALLLALGTTTNVFASVKNDIKIEVVGGGDIDIYNNKKDANTKDALNQKEENKFIPYSQDEYQYLQINFSEPFTEERYLELLESGESFCVNDTRLKNIRMIKTPILLNSINFPDINFRSTLENLYSVTAGSGAGTGSDISSQIASTVSIVLGKSTAGNMISDLTGIKYFTNLTSLRVVIDTYTNNDMTEGLDEIGSLINLVELTIVPSGRYKNFGKDLDISYLDKLINLERLTITTENRLITTPYDISSISNLTNLKYLSFSYGGPRSLAPIQNLTNLEYLGLEDCSNTPKEHIKYLPTIKGIKPLAVRVPDKYDFSQHTPNHKWY